MLKLEECMRQLTSAVVFHKITKLPSTDRSIEYFYTEKPLVKSNGLTEGIVVISKRDFDYLMGVTNE